MKKVLSLIIISLALAFNVAIFAKTEKTSSESGKKAAAAMAENQVVDINTATAAELQTLKGIGQKKAEAIVAYREEHGKFKSVEDLKQVHGFGHNALARLEKNNPGRLTAKIDS